MQGLHNEVIKNKDIKMRKFKSVTKKLWKSVKYIKEINYNLKFIISVVNKKTWLSSCKLELMVLETIVTGLTIIKIRIKIMVTDWYHSIEPNQNYLNKNVFIVRK